MFLVPVAALRVVCTHMARTKTDFFRILLTKNEHFIAMFIKWKEYIQGFERSMVEMPRWSV